MKKIPKVLICSPIVDFKMYCYDDWIENINKFTYPNWDIFLADNSPNDKNYKYLIKQGINCEYIKPKKRTMRERLALSHEACREYAIRYKYDYIFHLETDIFPKANIIEELLFTRKRTVGAMYNLLKGSRRKLMIQLKEDSDAGSWKTTRYLLDMETTFVDGTVKRVWHLGLGCILIHKKVFKTIPFRYDIKVDFSPDTFFALDMDYYDMPIYCHTGIICEHRDLEYFFENSGIAFKNQVT